MRIAFTIHKFPPESLGGTEIYAWSLARGLTAAGHEVHVFYPLAGTPPEERQVVHEGLHLWRAPLPATRASENPAAQYWHTFRDAAIEKDFAHFLAETKPDLVHFQHVQGVSARLISLARHLPRVMTLHDYWYFCANSQLIRPDRQVCGGPRAGWSCVDCATARADLQPLRALRPLVALPFAYRNTYLRGLLRSIDLFIAPSYFLRQQYVGQGFPGDRIRVLENGVDLERLRAESGAVVEPPPLRPHIAFIGSLAWQKGVHVLIKAFNQISEQAALTIYGSEKVFPEYAQELRQLAANPTIRFAGALNHRAVGKALQTIDCLVVPSVWYENSPLVIQEAFAMSVPVVASRLGALEEKVQEGVNGRLFAPGDDRELARILRQLIGQPQQLASLRQAIRPGPDMWQHSQMVEALYREISGAKLA